MSSLRQFFHGHTFAGNPLAAAAALASLELLSRQRVVDSVREKGDYLRTRLQVIAEHPHVGSVRGRGMMIGIELVADRATKQGFDSSELRGRAVCERALAKGVWIRPLGDVVVIMPPLVAERGELDLLAEAVIDSIVEEFRGASPQRGSHHAVAGDAGE